MGTNTNNAVIRCGAKTRSGGPCRNPVVKDKKRCRMHGGTNPGAPKGNRNAYKHGNRSAEAEAQLKLVRKTNRDLRILTKLGQGIDLSPSELERLLELRLDAQRARQVADGASAEPRS